MIEGMPASAVKQFAQNQGLLAMGAGDAGTPGSTTGYTPGGAAIIGIVPVDTVKRVHKNIIRDTLPRENLVLAQTPQVFRFDLLKRAFSRARADGFTGTDEASLVERLEEVEVTVVQGSDRNIKITRPTDMDLARLFLSEASRPAKS